MDTENKIEERSIHERLDALETAVDAIIAELNKTKGD